MDEVYSSEHLRSRSFNLPLKSDLGVGLFTAIFLALLAAYSVYEQTPPRAVAADAPTDVYSSGRAMRHLAVIARRPHPIGSAEHEAVRDYIFQELTALGLQPEVQEAIVVSPRGNTVRAATVHNVVVRLTGTGGGKALLLVGHYDTVPNAPGASDDGSSVATMLETVRVLKADAPTRNDVIFLFTDGEEVGMMGARAFAQQHPWAKDVGLVLNFEARGAGGPVLLFETSRGNDWLIKEAAKAMPRPNANSLSYEIYKRLPNNTDLSVFEEAGLPGMNFAYIDGVTRYHTRADNLENLDERSLQHQGAYALALARHFGNSNLNQPGKDDAVYFDLLGMTLLHYRADRVIPLTILTSCLFAAVAALGLMKRRLTVGGIAAGFFLFILNLVVATGAVFLIWWLVTAVQNRLGRSLQDDVYSGKVYLLGFSLFAVAVTAALYNLFRRRVEAENLATGALLCWLILLVLTSLYVPGGSYLLTWPLLLGLVALAFRLLTKADGRVSVIQLAVISLCAVPCVVLLVPMIYNVFVGLGVDSLWLIMPGVLLACGLLIPHFTLMSAPGKWLLPAGAATAAALLLAAAAFNSGFDKQHPKADHLFYVLNADTGRAVWASVDNAVDEWTGRLIPANAEKGPLTDYMPQSVSSYLRAAAPAVPLPTAGVQVLSDTTQGDSRTLHVRVMSQHKVISITVPGDAGAEVTAASIDGKRVEASRAASGKQAHGAWSVQYWAPPAEGFDLILELKGSRPVSLNVLEQSYGLPEIPETPLTPRPDYIMPSSFVNSDSSLVSKSYVL